MDPDPLRHVSRMRPPTNHTSLQLYTTIHNSTRGDPRIFNPTSLLYTNRKRSFLTQKIKPGKSHYTGRENFPVKRGKKGQLIG